MLSRKMVAAIAIAFSAGACGGGSVGATVTPTHAEAPEKKFPVNPSGVMKVAFVVSEGATLIDVAGPMQVFDQVQTPGATGFETFTVSESRKPIHAGTLTIVPDHSFTDMPDADIVVVPAQSGNSEPYLKFLRDMAARGKLILSVCTGASKLAQAGLLDGLEATSHHDFVDGFQKTYPKVSWIRDRAYVHSAPMIYTAAAKHPASSSRCTLPNSISTTRRRSGPRVTWNTAAPPGSAESGPGTSAPPDSKPRSR
ncbi:MAG: DJ-1/PfpI family protein [Sphingomonas sp.]